jgi:5-methylcytosine-specific restriction endonuclease McrA
MQRRKLRRTFQASHGYCHWCDNETHLDGNERSKRKATRDHILPKSKGGSWNLANLILACAGCNRKRGDAYYEQFLIEMELKNTSLFKKHQYTKLAKILFECLAKDPTS